MKRYVALFACIFALTAACGTGRVSGGQGTEMMQAEEYEPETKVEPPQGNIDRTSGPLDQPDPPPVLQVDLERRQPPPGPDLEPEPEPGKESE
ncbi:MAG: hypothetical protein OES69_06525 [Myxococcales bacterium]|nr:hypothetical protein [Myxococcales bacterium]MDH3843574.1 hypothetical protein [Myxococcales bacterium]